MSISLPMSSDNIAEFSCRFCNGEGFYPNVWDKKTREVIHFSDHQRCPVCRGLTLMRLKIPDTVVNCAMCKGTGRASELKSTTKVRPCLTCQGLGIQPLTGVILVQRGKDSWKLVGD